MRRLVTVSVTVWLALAPAVSAAERRGGPLAPGEPFPVATYKVLNGAPGATVDLAGVIGRRPVVLCYWIAGYARSEQLLQQLQALAEEIGSERLALYGVAVERPGRGADAIRERIAALGIRVPVLDDVGFRLGAMLAVQSVPDITVIDKEGRLRLGNGASLRQTLEYKMDLEAAIRRVADTGRLGTYGYLDRYYPVNEMVGQPCPDFTAPLLNDKVERRWSSLLDDGKLNVLIFWSVDCPHCQRSLPQINEWLKAHPGQVNVISAASVDNPTTRIKTREFCDLHGFVFPTLIDEDKRISERFQITSTPTILLIRPDGVVDSVLLSDLTDFGEVIEARQEALRQARGS